MVIEWRLTMKNGGFTYDSTMNFMREGMWLEPASCWLNHENLCFDR